MQETEEENQRKNENCQVLYKFKQKKSENTS